MWAAWRNFGACTSLVTLFLLSGVNFSDSSQYIVGDAAGWTLPSFGHVNYTVWASEHTFHAGDSLEFIYRADLHNVLTVSQSDYETCSTSKPTAMFDDGKTVISLSTAGSKYFLCGVNGHCLAGQKVQINVLAGKSVTPIPSPTSGFLMPSQGGSRTPVGAPHSGSKKPAVVIAGSVLSAIINMGTIGAILKVFL